MKRTKQTRTGNVTDINKRRPKGWKRPALRGVGKPKREWTGGIDGLKEVLTNKEDQQ